MEKDNHFKILNAVDVSSKTEQKKDLTYLSWAHAWGEVKKIYPNANYSVLKFGEACLPYVLDEATGYMVYTAVEIDGVTHEMFLPVMDGANKAMKNVAYEYSTKYGKKTVEAATMFDINKAIMRCLTKNIAMFGLGLYIYAGEDLPEDVKNEILRQEEELEALYEELKALTKELGGRNNPAVKETVEANLECTRISDCKDATKIKKAIAAFEKMKEKKEKK